MLEGLFLLVLLSLVLSQYEQNLVIDLELTVVMPLPLRSFLSVALVLMMLPLLTRRRFVDELKSDSPMPQKTPAGQYCAGRPRSSQHWSRYGNLFSLCQSA
jgi:hypothetical protein